MERKSGHIRLVKKKIKIKTKQNLSKKDKAGTALPLPVWATVKEWVPVKREINICSFLTKHGWLVGFGVFSCREVFG